MQKICSDTCSVIILNYNGWKDTLACLNKVDALVTRPRRTIVVDNCSTDDSIENIMKYWQAPRQAPVIHESEIQYLTAIPESDNILLVCSRNRGYAAGNNLGIILAKLDPQCPAVWILNNDTEPDPMSLEHLCATMNSHPAAGISGSTQVFARSGVVQSAGGGSVNRWLGTTHSLKEFFPLHEVLQCGEATINAQIDFTAGASMLVRRQTIEQVGLLPEEYFLYYEDVDYGVRVKKTGFDLVWARNSIVYHHDGSSTRKQEGTAPAWVDFLILRNRLYFIKKYFIFAVPSAIFGYTGVAFNRIRRGQVERLKNIFPAIFDALNGKMGKSDRAMRIASADVKAHLKSIGKTNLTFSLVVATYNRVTPLAYLLQTLRDQTYKQFETIIVDQNPNGYLDQLLENFTDLNLKIVRAEPKGVSQARNAGLQKATGDVVAFPDDDCWYGPDTLDKVNQVLNANQQLDGLLVGWADCIKTQTTLPVITPVDRIRAFSRAETYVQFYRKEALNGILFDPELGPGTKLPYGCGEDTDFLLQIIARNKTIGRTNEVLVYHPKPNLEDPLLLKKTAAYACGRMRLLQKYNFPLWFKLANVFFPLFKALQEGRAAWPYRWTMFINRLKAF